MIECLYAGGDSYTAGVEIQDDQSFDESNKALSYPMYLADKLKIKKCDNRALPNASNDFIARKAILDLEGYKEKQINLSNVFVIIGWTDIYKTEISLNEIKQQIKNDEEYRFELMSDVDCAEYHLFGTKFVTPNVNESGKLLSDVSREAIDWLSSYMWDYELEYEKWYANIIMLKNYLENNNCKFLFHNTKQRCDVISNIYKFDNYYQPTGESFDEWCNSGNYERRKLGYPVEEAHGNFSDVLLEYIKEKNLL